MAETLSVKKVVQWEYKEVVVGANDASVLPQLTVAGADGWEFILARQTAGYNQPTFLYFKRRAQS